MFFPFASDFQMMLKFICLYLVLLSVEIFSQSGSVGGRVTDDTGPFQSVNIIIMETGRGTVSDSTGSYEIRNVPAGEYEIRFSAVGYESVFENITIVGGKRVQLDVRMKVTAIEFGTIEIVDKGQVQGDTRTSFIDLNPRSAKVLPGAAEDVMRTLQALPGVLAPNDYSSQLIIRGSGPDQNLIIMDDIEVFNPYRLYGVISMFNPDAVSDINLISGGFPARYGDRLSAVLDVTNREGLTKNYLSGSLNASIIDANLVLEGRNPFNVPGSWIVNSRRTYYDLIIEPFVKNAGLVEEDVTFPNFYDFQGKVVFGPFNGHRFLINGIHSQDGVNVVSSRERSRPDSIGVYNVTRNDIAGLAWHYVPSKNLLNKLTLSWYRNGGVAEFDSRVLDPSLDRERFRDVLADTISSYLLNVNFDTEFLFEKYSLDNKFTYFWGENTFEAGAGADFMTSEIILNFDIDPQLKAFFLNNPQFTAVFNNIRNLKEFTRYRVYMENNFSLGRRLFFHPGVRLDYYDVLGKLYLSPRISLSYAINNITTLRGVWGMYYQSPGYEKLLDQSSLIDLNEAYTRTLNAENAFHYILGIERWLTSEWNLRLEGYYKDFRDLIIQQRVSGTRFFTEPVPGRDPRYLTGWTPPIPVRGDSLTQIPVNNSYGEAYGIEVLLAKRNIAERSRISGWISYAHAYAYRFDNGKKFPFRFDQRNTINIVMNYQYNQWWSVGLRWQYGSGFPYSQPLGIMPRIYYADTDLDGEPDSPLIAVRRNEEGENEVIYDVNYDGQKLNARKPPYHRLDLRLTALAEFWSLDWTFYLDIINVYNRSNVIGYNYSISPELTLERRKSTMFPIIPTFGFSVKF
jgi:hypothetical protein